MKGASRRSGWVPALASAGLPYRAWLADRGSLTARLQARCGKFSVRPLRQHLARPLRDEAALLGLRAGELALVREVYLYCGGEPVVFAHSVLRREDLDGVWRAVARQGARSLGATLFSNPRVARTPLVFRALGARHPLHRRACERLEQRPRKLWARRSLFRLEGAPLLVTEVFLPGVLELKG